MMSILKRISPNLLKYQYDFTLLLDQLVFKIQSNNDYDIDTLNEIRQNLFDNFDNFLNFYSNEKELRLLLYGQVQSGKTNNLVLLLKFFLAKGYIVIILTGDKNDLNQQFKNRLRKLLTDYEFSLPNYKILKKQTDNLTDEVIKIISRQSNKKVLIIDDEADYATASNVQKSFDRLKNIERFDWIGCTATPGKIILQTKNDWLKYENILLLKNSSKYKGTKHYKRNINTLFLVDQEKFNKLWEVAKIREEIKEWQEIDFIELLGKEWLAIYSYAFYKYCVDNRLSAKSKLIINIDIKQEKQNYQLQFIKWLQFLFKSNIHFRNLIYDFFDIKNREDRKTLSGFIIKKIKIYEYNSNSNYEIIASDSHLVLVGGYKLSRGITFDNLTHVVLKRYGNAFPDVSLMLQNSRWFGYHNPSPVIFTYKEVKDEYLKVFKIDNELRKFFDMHYDINNLEVKQIVKKYAGDKKI